MHLAGIVLDIYDDPKGLILRQKLAASKKELPQKLASARVLTAPELDELPDRLFAMVADNGDQVVRKYSMHDEAHLVTSMVYFDATRHLLPENVQSKIACNLVNGCAWYGMDPPESIVKVAIGVLGALTAGLGVKDMASKAREGAQQGRERMEAFRQAQASGTKVAAGREIQLTLEQDHALQHGEGPESGYIMPALEEFSNLTATHKKLDAQLAKRDQPDPMYGSKRADLVGTEAMPQATLRSGSGRPSPTKRLDLPMKTSAARIAAECIPEGWVHCGDITHESTPVTQKTASYEHFALPHLRRFPIDNAELVQKAASYFDEYVFEIPLPDRRVFAQSVFNRANELGTKIAGSVLDYAGESYGPNLIPGLHTRIHQFEGTDRGVVYELLLEKQAEITPMVMAEMLREADEETGVALSYGRPSVGVLDPYMTVYGGPKLAAKQPPEEDTYSWSEGNDYVSGIQLKAYASQALRLDDQFGQGFASSFQKDPIGIFKSLPSPQKVVLSRLAGDMNPGIYRI